MEYGAVGSELTDRWVPPRAGGGHAYGRDAHIGRRYEGLALAKYRG